MEELRRDKDKEIDGLRAENNTLRGDSDEELVKAVEQLRLIKEALNNVKDHAVRSISTYENVRKIKNLLDELSQIKLERESLRKVIDSAHNECDGKEVARKPANWYKDGLIEKIKSLKKKKENLEGQ